MVTVPIFDDVPVPKALLTGPLSLRRLIWHLVAGQMLQVTDELKVMSVFQQGGYIHLSPILRCPFQIR